MASDFPIQYYTGTELGPMNEVYIPDATNGVNIKVGSLVFRAGDGEVELCATDPVSILGIAKVAYADRFLYQAFGSSVGRILVARLSPSVRIGLCVGAGTLTAANEGIDYGLSLLASTNWAVNLADTTGPTFHIVKADVTNQIAWGYFLAAALQDDAIAS